jgi:ADP-ribose pyrophosphatase YjhB (NUDIX family)
MVWTPHATVAALVEREGRFLFVEEIAHGERVFNQPAGHVDEDESLENATIRETIEESGWEVKPSALVGIYTYKAPSNGVTYYRFCYVCEAIKEIPNAELDSDILAAHWFTLEEIKSKQNQLRSPLVMKCLEDYLAGKQYPLDLIYES